VRLLCSSSVPVPITVRILNPLIILPERLLQSADEEVLTTAIGHELVHVCRRDYLANLVYELIYLPLSFHPALALVRRRIKQNREICCDEAVATKLLRAETYARSLVRLIGSAPLGRRLAPDTTIGISESDILEVRIMSLLKPPKLTSRRKKLLLIAASLLLVAPCVAATSFALTLDIDRSEPSVTPQTSEKIDRANQVGVREDLKRAVRELQEQKRTAPASQVPEIDARLRELQRTLEENDRLRPDAEARLREVQQNLAEHERLIEDQQNREADQKRLEELRTTLAQLEKNQPADEARMKEVREKIAEMERLYTSAREGELQSNYLRSRQEAEELEKRAEDLRLIQSESQSGEMKMRRDLEQQGREERARRQAELTRGAVLSMDRAIQIATSQVPGKVLACSLGRDGDKLFYHVVIIGGDGDKSTTTYVWVSAIDGQILKTEKEEPRKEEAANESAPRAQISGGVLNGKATSLPPPVYPAIARAAHASGAVTVEVTIGENGNVIAAHAVSGHPLLQAAAVNAARQASFAPTRVNGEPVKVAGVLVYNFVAQ
jgi:TonB family protein